MNLAILGITGTLGAGKGTIVKHLERKGYRHFSVRQAIIEGLKSEGIENPLRPQMVEFANRMRLADGAYFAKALRNLVMASGAKLAIIESIRSIDEVDWLEKNGIPLFSVDADRDLRYLRIAERKDSTDHISYEEFLNQEAREWENADPKEQNLKYCIEKTNPIFRFINNGTPKELWDQVDSVMVLANEAERV